MPSLFNSLPILFLVILFVLCSYSVQAKSTDFSKADYQLSISFDLDKKQLIGTAKINIKKAKPITLFLNQLEVTGTLLRDENGSEYGVKLPNSKLQLDAADSDRTLFISYTLTVQHSYTNLISAQGISLTSQWFPQPEEPMLFAITATIPKNFSAIVEADTFPLEKSGDTVFATFSNPVSTLHFIAGPYALGKMKVRDNLFVYSLFFKEDKELAGEYLQAGADYIRRYENEIGPFPYNHYVITANRLPTGYGMPTFTLLGQMVLRLPFIKTTSLGHEIVHSWFGNSVEVDYSTGNWCEGLTTFLADHAYRKVAGEEISSRKEAISRYLSYLRPEQEENHITLSQFFSASHRQHMAEAKRTVGYDRGALLFNELQQKIGEDAFRKGLQLLYQNFAGKRASWQDLKESFETASGRELATFFEQRLTRKDIPNLAVVEESIEITYQNNKPYLSFVLLQKSKSPFKLLVPIRISSTTNSIDIRQMIDKEHTQLSLPLTGLHGLPVSFIIDPKMEFLRQLVEEEKPPILSEFFGADKQLLVMKASDSSTYEPITDTLLERYKAMTLVEGVSNKEISKNNILFLGTDHPASRSIFGKIDHNSQHFTLEVRRNPLNPQLVVVLVTSPSIEQSKSVARKLRHYTKYSFLEFQNGRNIEKKITPTQNGMKYRVTQLPSGGATNSLSSFEKIADELAKKQVIYVGETHTSYADHLLQLRLIESIHARHPQLAIGMEMFPEASQKALDQYTLSQEITDEKEFLRESNYYNVWRYDYRYFRDIFNFAKRKKLPVVALNLERAIVSQVFRSGSTDDLSDNQKQALPLDRDLSLPGYTERLSRMHNVHVTGQHAMGAASGFIQAQSIWDETMAENITTFLTSNPDHKMIVLAGSQHTRKDSGIPPRVAKRIEVEQASVLNVYNENPPANIAEIADYFFFATPLELPTSPKIGIVLTPLQGDRKNQVKIEQLSPHGKAKEAGLLPGDILVTVNGFTVKEMADLMIAMTDTKPGDIIEITVNRDSDGQPKEKKFEVELTSPPKMMPHP